jgi:eukaryotic-like serine/threonine-protein kinase
VLGNRYEIIEKIGGGGMAMVYRAKCRLLNRYVAVKILRNEYTSDKDLVNKFKRESQAVASLSHPNIVNVYDVGEVDDLYYIVMEMVSGKTLKKSFRKKAPCIRKRLFITQSRSPGPCSMLITILWFTGILNRKIS